MYENYGGRLLSLKPIKELSLCEVFVFGSNLQGHHRGGAARTAMDHFGAQWGNGVGLQGQSYAIPTMFSSVDEMKPYVDEFVEYVKNHPMNRFLITRLGCGIAGFSDKQVAPMFDKLYNEKNAVFSLEWWWVLNELHYGEEKPSPEVPDCIDENVLVELSRKYRYEIGAGLHNSVPNILIRYVIRDNQFGYAGLHNSFFFHSQYEFYVFDKDEKWKEQHADYILLDEFHDQCWNQGYVRRVHFAGVRTPYIDKKGDYIYTGDVVRAKFNKSSYVLPVGTFMGSYAFVLDNHNIPLDECTDFERLGTVFYGMDSDFEKESLIRTRNHIFFGSAYGYVGAPPTSTLGKELTKARLTPNFIHDDIEYIVLDNLEVDYNWRH